MSNSPDSHRQQRLGRWYSCKHCGGVAAPQSILDTRQGKSFRLLRCVRCEKTDWMEEQ